MAVAPFEQLMAEAKADGYAVGYFESWNLESLLAVADAAEAVRSPVILGFSGIYLPHPDRVVTDPLSAYAAVGLDTCRRLTVPACLTFNESPSRNWVSQAIELGFHLVMYSDERITIDEQTENVRHVCAQAHTGKSAVEAELMPLPGVGGQAAAPADASRLTDPDQARAFVDATGVDALAVNIGQRHLHGRQTVRLDLDRLDRLKQALDLPLVLHGASSVDRGDLEKAIGLGVCKINLGSVLKQAYLAALRDACQKVKADANPYEVIGSGLASDVLAAGRLTMQKVTEQWMNLFGSAGKAPARAKVAQA